MGKNVDNPLENNPLENSCSNEVYDRNKFLEDLRHFYGEDKFFSFSLSEHEKNMDNFLNEIQLLRQDGTYDLKQITESLLNNDYSKYHQMVKLSE